MSNVVNLDAWSQHLYIDRYLIALLHCLSVRFTGYVASYINSMLWCHIYRAALVHHRARRYGCIYISTHIRCMLVYMCMFMHVCTMFVCTYVCIRYVGMHALCMYTCTHMYIYVCVDTCFVCVYVCIYLGMCVSMYVYTYVVLHIRTYMYTYLVYILT